MAVGILEPQAHLGSVFLEVKKLSGVKGSASLPKEAEKMTERKVNSRIIKAKKKKKVYQQTVFTNAVMTERARQYGKKGGRVLTAV